MIPGSVAEAEAAELEELREMAAQQRRRVGETMAALSERVSQASRPRVLARRTLRAWRRRARSAPGALARHPAFTWAAVGTVAATAGLWWTARHRDRAMTALARAAAPPLAHAAAVAIRRGWLSGARRRRPGGRRRTGSPRSPG